MTLKQRIKFFFQGKPYLKIITILLSAVAFALCAIASTGYTNDNADYLARALINYSIPFTIVQYDHNDNSIGERNILSQDVIDIFEDTGIDYLYGYTSSFSSYDIEDDAIIYASKYYLAGKQSVAESFGFKVVAGRYPETVDEIAISDSYFETFKNHGYRNVYSEYKKDNFGYYRDASVSGETFDINDYSDIIGKTFTMPGNIKTGEGFNEGTAIYEAKIVGVIDTSSMETEGYRSEYFYPAQKLYLSEAWREKFFYKNGEWQDNQCEYLYGEKVEDYKTAYKVAIATFEACNLIEELGEKNRDEDVVEVNGTLALLDGRQELYLRAFKILGVPLAALSVVVQILAAVNSMFERRKQIGILQSLGAGKKQLFFLLLSEALALGLIICAIAVPLSYEVFINAVQVNLYNDKYMVCLLEFKAMNFVIVGAMSILLPLITTAISSAVFLRRAPIDNIRNLKIVKPPRETCAEKKRK